MASRAAVSTLARLSPMCVAHAPRAFGVLPSPLSVASRGRKSGQDECTSPLSAARRLFMLASPLSQIGRNFNSKSPFNNLMTTSIGAELDYRMDFAHPELADGVSPWHDLPHQVTNSTFVMVNEIPKGARAKFEVQPKVQGNPIKQDVKQGKPRYFQFGDIPFNYGMIPQTWEDPRVQDQNTGCNGDGDPLDVVEISDASFSVGGTHEIKVLGALGLIDEGEMDWKIIAIDVHNPLADRLNSLQDIEKYLPGALARIQHWFRFYKTPEGKGANEFAFDGAFQDAEFAIYLIDKHHKQYVNLIIEGPQDTNVWTPPKKNDTLRPNPKSQ